MTYRFSSWLYARLLGVICLVAFVSLGVQVPALFAGDGVAPIADLIASAQRANHAWMDHPTLFWAGAPDWALLAVVVLGAAAAALLTAGVAPAWMLLVCWLCYLSFVSVGWPFMSFQWDTLLLETLFASIFFVPWVWRDRRATHATPHPLARWALWWLLWRLMVRSAYVKLASGDTTWADLSALQFHYWTQPLPTALAWYAHHLPSWFHTMSCALMFAIEFGAPLWVLVPGAGGRRAAAALLGGLMLLIAATGNYGFFNLLTLALCVTLLDDNLFEKHAPRKALSQPRWKAIAAATGAVFVIAMSTVIFVTGTFGSTRPAWLRPVYPFSTFNNYGLFAVMTTNRREIVLEGSADGQTWKPYEFHYKPGDLARAPAWNAPHQPRLDWQMWFAALGDFRRNTWLASVMRGLLRNDPTLLDLLATNPFPDKPPNQVRAVAFDYRFTTPSEREASGNWWARTRVGLYAPVLDQSALRPPPSIPR